MTLDKLGQPFQGEAWYWIEDSYAEGESSTTLPISCKVQNVRIDTGDRHKVLKDIGSPLACHLLKQTYEPKVHIEYIPQCDDTMIDDVIDRSSECTLQSIALFVNLNKEEDDSDDQSSYFIIGMKPSTVRITSSKNTEYLIVIDFEAQSVSTEHSSLTATRPSPLTGDYLAFNIAGEITKTGGHIVNTDHIAFCTNSVEITVSHKLTGYTDHDSLYKSYLIEGDMDIEGSVDITLDGGGASHIYEVFQNTEFDLQIDLGGVGCPRLTLPDCQWKNASVNVDTGGEGLTNSTPFTCKPSSCTNIVSQVPAP